MAKNILIAVLIILVLVEGGYVLKERAKVSAALVAKTSTITTSASGSVRARPRPMLVIKGSKFSQSPLFEKAYLIFPTSGDLSADAKTALTGWDMKTSANSDGSTQVDLIPYEAEDIKQSFTVRSGYKLYFIEMTLVDDKSGVDENRGDDIGVLVDPNGIVQ